MSFTATPHAVGEDPSPSAASPEAIEFFEKKIRPALADHCYECHSSKSNDAKGSLHVDTRQGLLEGGDSGPAVVPGDPERSKLIEAIRYGEDSYQMPPKGKLPAEVIADFERWVREGAADPRVQDPAGEAKEASQSPQDAAAKHWSFQPLQRPALPPVMDRAWPRAPIDSFVAARLATTPIPLSPAADRRALLRRLTYDLTGLPPSYEELEAFAADPNPAAYEKRVDALLASPAFGERWSRHWLDVARYADTKGYVFMEDRSYADAWKFRDWVTRSFNQDLPYDQFLRLQLAADRLAPDDDSTLAAMGFLTLGRRFINNKHDIIDDRIDVVTRGMLGLTVTCARCHDHKYDPIPTADYYSLYGVFSSSREPNDEPGRMRLVDVDRPHNARIFLRGNARNQGEEVPRRFLEVLSGENRPPFTDGSGRLELAAAIVSPENPLTARVMVNRVWGHLFGRGLAPTPSDFGLRSEAPQYPELLDTLASDFLESGWSIKELVRSIVLSSVYRQSSVDRPEALAHDPENLLLSRGVRRRLDFEALRDSLLAVGRGLDRAIGGPSVNIAERRRSPRRTLYAHIDRQNLPAVFRTFDFASPDTHAPERYETTVPQQALYLMNGRFALGEAREIGRELASLPAREAAIEAYRRLLARDPAEDELAAAIAFLDFERAHPSEPATSRRPDDGLLPEGRLAQVLLLSNEFAVVD